MKLLLRPLAALWLYMLLLGLGITSLAWNLAALLLWPLLRRPVGQRIGRAAISHVYRGFWATAQATGMMRVDASALDVLRDEPGGLIIAANHPTMLDALLIVARLPRGVCIMKAELMRNAFLGSGARLARYIRNDAPHKMVRHAVASLREGGQLVLFPEGTRTVHPPLNPLLPGLTLISQKAGVPIQTIIIETRSPYLGKGWPIWRVPPFPLVFRLRLGERFPPSPDHHATLARLDAYFRKELA